MINLLCVIALVCVTFAGAFVMKSSSGVTRSRSGISMEYIPDGFTKKQWQELKAKEEAEKKKNLGQLGVGKFKSRSFEAWQKSGGKHLFPVDPNNSKYEERPYMQRRGGDWEGNDLKERGLKGFGQGTPYERLDLDNMYERAQKAGMLNSVSIFGGAPLPWTNDDASKMNNSKEKEIKYEQGVAGKKLSEKELAMLKKSLAKPVFKQTNKAAASTASSSPAPEESAPKKKLFGLF